VRSCSEPLSDPGFVAVASCDGEHGGLGVVDVGWVGIPGAVVEIDKEDERGPCGALVAVGERVVPREPADEDRGFVEDVG